MTANATMNAMIRSMMGYGASEDHRDAEQPETTDVGETAERAAPCMNQLMHDLRSRRRDLVPPVTVGGSRGRRIPGWLADG